MRLPGVGVPRWRAPKLARAVNGSGSKSCVLTSIHFQGRISFERCLIDSRPNARNSATRGGGGEISTRHPDGDIRYAPLGGHPLAQKVRRASWCTFFLGPTPCRQTSVCCRSQPSCSSRSSSRIQDPDPAHSTHSRNRAEATPAAGKHGPAGAVLAAQSQSQSAVRHGQHTHTASQQHHEQQPAAGSHPTGRAPGTIARGSMQCLVPQSAVCVGWLATGDWTRTRRDWLNAVRQAQPAA
jgi:hypothetical protein